MLGGVLGEDDVEGGEEGGDVEGAVLEVAGEVSVCCVCMHGVGLCMSDTEAESSGCMAKTHLASVPRSNTCTNVISNEYVFASSAGLSSSSS